MFIVKSEKKAKEKSHYVFKRKTKEKRERYECGKCEWWEAVRDIHKCVENK